MKFPSVFKAGEVTWRWRSCKTTPKTVSFRATVPDSFLDEEEKAVVSGVRSERLFFEPGKTNSILEEAKHADPPTIDKETVEMESFDPVLDFRVSMEEMVGAHGGRRDWEFLEELLRCYLEVNERRNYAYIVEAFADMLILRSTTPNLGDKTRRRPSFTSPLSFTSCSTASPTSPPPG